MQDLMARSILPSILLLSSLSMVLACHPIHRVTTQQQRQMFTVDQIKAAHSKVQSGADFPAYIQDLKGLGVTSYVSYVADGHTDYYGDQDYQVSSAARYAPLGIAPTCDQTQFKAALKAHQQGQTDYPTFVATSAQLGVEKWIVRMQDMTCTYYDLAGMEVLVEAIPAP